MKKACGRRVCLQESKVLPWAALVGTLPSYPQPSDRKQAELARKKHVLRIELT